MSLYKLNKQRFILNLYPTMSAKVIVNHIRIHVLLLSSKRWLTLVREAAFLFKVSTGYCVFFLAETIM